MRLIDADALEKEWCSGCEHEKNKYANCDDCALAHAPTVEPERKKGKWIYYERREPKYDIEGVKTWAAIYKCSECGFIHNVIENFGIYSFCPNCGSDMRG